MKAKASPNIILEKPEERVKDGKDTMTDSELAQRMAKAFRELGFFVFQRELDSPTVVFKLLRELELTPLLNTHNLPQGIYVLTINLRPCQIECRLKRCKEAENREKCIEDCVGKCKEELATKIAEVLESHARGKRSN